MPSWVFITVIAIVASTVMSIANGFFKVRASHGDSGPINRRVEALEQEMATVRQELVEAQERLDFTERLLAKQKDATRMGPG